MLQFITVSLLYVHKMWNHKTVVSAVFSSSDFPFFLAGVNFGDLLITLAFLTSIFTFKNVNN